MRTMILRPLSPCSTCVTIPIHLINEMDWHVGDHVTFKRMGESIIVTPVTSRSAKNCDVTEAEIPTTYGGIRE